MWSPLDPEDIHTHSLEAHWKFQGGEKGGWGGVSPRPTFLMYSLYGLKMNISRGALVGNTDTLEQLRHCKK